MGLGGVYQSRVSGLRCPAFSQSRPPFLIKVGSSTQFPDAFLFSILPIETSDHFGGNAVSAPKFKVSIQGVLKGFSDTSVRVALASQLKMEPQQVDKLLLNQGALSKKLLPHKDAFSLQSILRELGVDCVIRPVPLEGLAERAGTLQMNVDARPKPVSRTPVVRSQRSSPVRSGRASLKPVVPKGAVSVWPVAAVVVLVLLASWLFKAPSAGLDAPPAPQMASILDRPLD